MQNHTKIIAAAFALCAFAIAIIAGLLAGNSATVVLARALAAMAICHIVGLAAAACLMRVIQEHLVTYATARPIPHIETGAESSGTVLADSGGVPAAQAQRVVETRGISSISAGASPRFTQGGLVGSTGQGG